LGPPSSVGRGTMSDHCGSVEYFVMVGVVVG
jgi:hypothetical protein